MPQPTQHSLIHVLLLWATILSFIQVVFITLLFTGGHHGLFQNKGNEASGGAMQFQANNPTSPPSEDKLLLGKGKMLTFKGAEVNNRTIKWIAISLGSGLISDTGNILTILKDGYYFLTLQVTLYSCAHVSTRELGQRVVLEWDTKVLLEGKINQNTCGTGLLGKVQELSAGGTLVVTIDPPITNINNSESLTHLDFIYMYKP